MSIFRFKVGMVGTFSYTVSIYSSSLSDEGRTQKQSSLSLQSRDIPVNCPEDWSCLRWFTIRERTFFPHLKTQNAGVLIRFDTSILPQPQGTTVYLRNLLANHSETFIFITTIRCHVGPGGYREGTIPITAAVKYAERARYCPMARY